jgi:hypothetical protein
MHQLSNPTCRPTGRQSSNFSTLAQPTNAKTRISIDRPRENVARALASHVSGFAIEAVPFFPPLTTIESPKDGSSQVIWDTMDSSTPRNVPIKFIVNNLGQTCAYPTLNLNDELTRSSR